MPKPKKLISLTGLARRVDMSVPRARAMVAAGELSPDFMGPNRLHLFALNRVPKLRAALALPPGGRVQ